MSFLSLFELVIRVGTSSQSFSHHRWLFSLKNTLYEHDPSHGQKLFHQNIISLLYFTGVKIVFRQVQQKTDGRTKKLLFSSAICYITCYIYTKGLKSFLIIFVIEIEFILFPKQGIGFNNTMNSIRTSVKPQISVVIQCKINP